MSLEEKVEAVFQHLSYVGNGVAETSEMPEEIRTALTYIVGSPMGKALVTEALRTGQRIDLVALPSNLRPDFRYAAGDGIVLYTLNLAAYKAQYYGTKMYPEVRDQTLDVILMHEVGHTPLGRAAYSISSQPGTLMDEFEDVRKVENPYRAFYGIPLRESYSGYPLQ